MIITFCGHSDFVKTKAFEDEMMFILQKEIGDAPAELFLGGYGTFDRFAYECGKKYKKAHPSVRLVLVTPYLNRAKNEYEEYDETVYPPIENVPYRFAISKRNKWMVEQADLVIACVNRSCGGAFQTLKCAQNKNKSIVNISNEK